MKYTVVDLFCGAGGLSKGFLDAGYNVTLGIDFDDMALKTFEKNHGNAKALKLDLFDLDNVIKIKEELNKRDIKKLDVLIGGPPCQGFSVAGNRVESDERNGLYKAMVKTAELLRPKVVLLENVTGMISLYEGKVKQKIFEDFENLGYTMNVKVLYAPDYGIPQIRKRAFFIGILDGKEPFEYPKPILDPENYITCEEAISDLPSLEGDDDFNSSTIREYSRGPSSAYQETMRKGADKVYNHIPTKHAQKTIDHIKLVPDGGKYKDLPPELAKNFKYHESLHRYNSKKPSLTIDTGHRTHFHYKYNRIPTVRENARLQSFPDTFIFYGNKQQQYKQVGNAVPPLLGFALANEIKSYLQDSNEKDNQKEKQLKFIDLFAGCGGLMEGFLQTGYYKHVASVEWEKAPVDTLKYRLETKWNDANAGDSVLRFDMQREDELFNGYDDKEYGVSIGLDSLINKEKGIDIVIGGPPCQAYSVAGRNKNRMDNDYRNYLFEHYVSVLKRYKPSIFVFENVPGMLTAMPDSTLITDLIRRDLEEAGYTIISDLKKFALIDMSEFGIPQTRKRVIIIGLRNECFRDPEEALIDYYTNMLPRYKSEITTLESAIGDLPKLIPLKEAIKENGKNISHIKTEESKLSWHEPRYANLKDIEIFRLLEKDIEEGTNEFTSISKLNELYEQRTGKRTQVHKYHVLRKNEPSTTILAHLYKDGFRFIHYDSEQARTITVREAARIQTFPDDFEFISSMGQAYKMIGNAVPPKFSEILGNSIHDFIKKYLNS